jgi:ribosome-associated protein
MATDRRPRKRAASRPKSTARRGKTARPAKNALKTPLKAPAGAKSRKTPRRAPKAVASAPVPADVMTAVAAAFDKKAEDVQLLDLREGSAFTDFFIICTGTNVRQVQAIADGVEEAMRKKGIRASLVEGYDRAEWILVDFFDFIVHVFTPSTREFYALDRLWGDAQRIEVSEQ